MNNQDDTKNQLRLDDVFVSTDSVGQQHQWLHPCLLHGPHPNPKDEKTHFDSQLQLVSL